MAQRSVIHVHLLLARSTLYAHIYDGNDAIPPWQHRSGPSVPRHRPSVAMVLHACRDYHSIASHTLWLSAQPFQRFCGYSELSRSTAVAVHGC